MKRKRQYTTELHYIVQIVRIKKQKQNKQKTFNTLYILQKRTKNVPHTNNSKKKHQYATVL